ncbi:MAG: pseudouridylate synthase [Muribaculaceae bacterium]|nr:pseudouridylate synthase [Muribaculaceae bacterium]
MNWDFEKIDIHELLPQQPPFVMVDKLLHFDERVTTTAFEVRAGNIFVDNGILNACALAENIAQTCAARLGFVNKYILKRAIQLGFIGSIRNMEILRTPIVGEQLTTTITVREEIMGLTLVDATIIIGNETIVTGEMKIALSDIEMQN